MEINVYVKEVNGGSIVQGNKTHQDRTTVTEEYLEYTKENEKFKVNQLDVRNKKDEQKTGMCV